MIFIFFNLVLSAFAFFLCEPTLAVSPTKVALGMSSDKLLIWDWITNNFSFVGLAYPTFDNVFFLKDGRLAGCVPGPNVNIWNLTSGMVDLVLSCTAFTFEEMGNGWFVTGDTKVQVWNISSGGTVVKTINSPNVYFIKELAVSNLLAVGYDNGDILIYDSAKDFILFKSLKGHLASVWVIDELPNGNILSCSSDQTVKLWNVTQTVRLTNISPFSGEIYALKLISRDTFVLGGQSNSVYVYKIDNSNLFVFNSSLSMSNTYVVDIKVTDTNLVIISLDDGSLVFLNGSNLALIKSYSISTSTAPGLAISISVPNKYKFNQDPISTVEDKKVSNSVNKTIWGNLKLVVGNTIGQSSAIGSSFQTKNRLKCLTACINNPSCRAATFDNYKNCTMFSVYPPSNGQPLISSIGTNLYYKF